MGIKRNLKYIGLLLILMILLTGCGKSKVEVRYADYDAENEVWIFLPAAFEAASKLSDEITDEETSPELYIAKLGFEGYRTWLKKVNQPDSARIVTIDFLDLENKAHRIWANDGKISLKEVARLTLDQAYYQEQMRAFESNSSQIDYQAWEEYLAYLLEEENNIQGKDSTIIHYEFKMRGEDEERLSLYTKGGYHFGLHKEKPYTYSHQETDSKLHLSLMEEKYPDTTAVEAAASANEIPYTEADIRKLPMLPQVKYDGGDKLTFHYPQINKTYTLILNYDAKVDLQGHVRAGTDYMQFVDFIVDTIDRKPNQVNVTMYLKIYSVTNAEIGELNHQYSWSNGKWQLTKESFEIFPVDLLKLYSSGDAPASVDPVKVMKSAVWVEPINEIDIVSLEFTNNEIHYGFYRSERVATESYRVQEVKGDEVLLIVNGSDRMKVKILDWGNKLHLYDGDGNKLGEYMTAKAWDGGVR